MEKIGIKKLIKYLAITIVSSLILITFFLIGGAFVTWNQQKPIVEEQINEYKNGINAFQKGIQENPVRILDKNGILIGEFFVNPYEPIQVSNLKDYKILIFSILSMEDRDFYNHSGINWFAIFRALIINLKNFKISQGGSTISQQLAKLIMNLGERNIFNKITEIFATYYIESTLSKDEILAIYLNKIYLGQNNYGVEQASRYYFNKSGKELNYAEAAMLAGLIPAPSIYNPINNLNIALTRQRLVLNAMAKNLNSPYTPDDLKNKKDFKEKIDGFIKQFKKKYNIKEITEEGIPTRYSSSIAEYGYDSNFNINLAPDFNSEIREFILDNYKNFNFRNGSIIVITTLDYIKQKEAEQVMKIRMQAIRADIDAKYKKLKSKKSNQVEVNESLIDEIKRGMQGAFVGLEPNTGNVEIFITNLRISSLYNPNRIENAYRQPGSTIKPLLYTMAFERGLLHPFSIVVDEKININGYSPKNWYGTYKGEIKVLEAIALSVNTIPVKILNHIGIDKFLDKMAEILDLSSQEVKRRFNRNLTLALGSGELSPMELAIIYATIQNGGMKIKPRKILKIIESNENYEEYTNLDLSQFEPTNYSVLNPIACAMTISSLSATLQPGGTFPLKENFSFPLAGKSGTVQTPANIVKKWKGFNGIRDAWFAGMIPGLTTVVWIGNEYGAPFPGSGSSVAGRIWVDFLKYYTQNNPIENQNLIPQNISGNFVKLNVCSDDGTILEDNWQNKLTDDGNPNPHYCSKPLFNQYFFIGELPTKRKIESSVTSEGASTNQIYSIQSPSTNLETADDFIELLPPEYKPIRENPNKVLDPYLYDSNSEDSLEDTIIEIQ